MLKTINWQVKKFNQLSTNQLYDFLKLRVDIFIVEQCCYYPDLDELDRHAETLHLFSYQQNTQTKTVMNCYLRILAKGQSYDDYISIGRVVVSPTARASGLGHELMQQALIVCQKNYPNQSIKISAQQHLEKFYQQHGFISVSEMYLEDGIPHIAMLKSG